MNPIEKKQRASIQRGFELLKKEKNYKQTIIVDKIKFMGFETSKSTFSLIINGKKIGSNALKNTSQGMKALVEAECGYEFNSSSLEYILLPKAQPIEVKVELGREYRNPESFIFHTDGRLKIEDKVKFYETAQKEIIEVGVTLNTFSQYFFSRNEAEFKIPIQKLLKKGVNFKCYLLHPESNECRLYVNDRKRAINEEQNELEKITLSIRRFAKIKKEFDNLNYAGTFEVYLYRHLPSNYYLAIDPSKKEIAKMMTASYLFGERRANCPILEFTRKNYPLMFQRYLDSLEKFILNAEKIDYTRFRN